MSVTPRDRKPIYQQIAGDLRDQITCGDYPVGAELPTLAELRTTYTVAEVTARNALALLDQEGIIAVRHGKRAIVLEPEDVPDESAYAQLRAEMAAMNRRMDLIMTRLDDLADAWTGHAPSTEQHPHQSS